MSSPHLPEGNLIMTQKRCGARARKGTGEGMCDQPLDEYSQCSRARQHLEAGEFIDRLDCGHVRGRGSTHCARCYLKEQADKWNAPASTTPPSAPA